MCRRGWASKTAYASTAAGRAMTRTPTTQTSSGLVEGAAYVVKRVPINRGVNQFHRSLLQLERDRLIGFFECLTSLQEEEVCQAHLVLSIALIAEVRRAEYTVMELLEGPDLYEYLVVRTATVPEATSASLARQMLLAVDFMHRRVGVLHKDIKPENFGFRAPFHLAAGPEGMLPLKLFDFGLSWVLPEVVREGAPPQLLEMPPSGTPTHMAPECWHHECGAPSDVWGVGFITHTLLCLGLPFGLAHTRNWRKALAAAELEFPDTPWLGLSRAARDFVEGALDKDPLERASAAQLLASPWLAAPGDAPSVELIPSCALPEKSTCLPESMCPLQLLATVS